MCLFFLYIINSRLNCSILFWKFCESKQSILWVFFFFRYFLCACINFFFLQKIIWFNPYLRKRWSLRIYGSWSWGIFAQTRTESDALKQNVGKLKSLKAYNSRYDRARRLIPALLVQKLKLFYERLHICKLACTKFF